HRIWLYVAAAVDLVPREGELRAVRGPGRRIGAPLARVVSEVGDPAPVGIHDIDVCVVLAVGEHELLAVWGPFRLGPETDLGDPAAVGIHRVDRRAKRRVARVGSHEGEFRAICGPGRSSVAIRKYKVVRPVWIDRVDRSVGRGGVRDLPVRAREGGLGGGGE